MAWDPKVYLAFGEERTRPARELLARINADDPRRIVDLGCGPGNSTALLAARWPAADLEGVDNSEAMLNDARKASFKAHWTLADVGNWNPSETYDVIFSNATLQWIGVSGLRDNGEQALARTIAQRWLATVSARYQATGKLVEKYDIERRRGGGGGEYPLQDGFGWTNGVTRALAGDYGVPDGN